MSRKTELEADLKRISYQLGGAHLTRETRSATFNTFAKVMRERGNGIHAAAQIGGKHLQAFAAHRAQHGISPRTRADELSHLRSVLVQIGKQGLARNPAYSNQALGIERTSRIGTKRPLSDEGIQAFQTRMEQLGRPAIGATLEVQRALGLRAAEAIRGDQAERSPDGIGSYANTGVCEWWKARKADGPEMYIRRTRSELSLPSNRRCLCYRRRNNPISSCVPMGRQPISSKRKPGWLQPT